MVERALVMDGEFEEPDTTGTRRAAPVPITLPEPAADGLPPVEVSRMDLAQPYKVVRAAVLERFEIAYLTALLERHQGNLTQSARQAQIDRVYLLRLLDKYGLRKRR